MVVACGGRYPEQQDGLQVRVRHALWVLRRLFLREPKPKGVHPPRNSRAGNDWQHAFGPVGPPSRSRDLAPDQAFENPKQMGCAVVQHASTRGKIRKPHPRANRWKATRQAHLNLLQHPR